MYLTLKHLHIALVVITASGFLLRAWWSVTDSSLRDHRLVRVLPHVIDTLLLSSGIGLLWLASFSMAQQPWLWWKLLGLVAYVVIGSVAIRYGRRRRTRLLAAVIAAGVFAYMLGAAIKKSALSWLVSAI
ncbi:MAG: SirB2 family protein [Pseudomonadota bacterium]